jgi:hypothetical protein
MKSLAVAVIAFLVALPSVVLAFEPPILAYPRICVLSSGGGSCKFGFDEDGIVKLPDAIVTGQVTVNGGRTVYIRGGHIRLSGSARYAIAFNSPNTVYVEGLRVDSNGYCDVFAVRNHRGIQTSFTFQNIYSEGPKYNVVDGNCHGDLIQNQGTEKTAGLDLRVENFVGVTGAQGFFIPFYGNRTMTAVLRNVYIRPTSNNWKPLLWFSSPKYGHPAYPVALDNVWVAWLGAGQFWPESRIESNGRITWPSSAKITGFVSKGFPVNEAEFKAHVGLAYDRSYFSPAGPPPEPEPDPVPEPEPELEPEPNPDEEPITKGKFKAWCRENHPRHTPEFCNI